nr:MaoC/PaaZ C-terminal domain-containing protein [Candidatus Sigynarchaeota archaeon]
MVKIAELKVGKEFSTMLGPSTRSAIKEYAKASTDRNAIHVSDDSAVAAGLSGVIQHGMLGYAYFINYLNEWVGKDGKLKSIDCEMRGMVRPGDMMEIKFKIEEIKGKIVKVSWEEYSITPFTVSKGGKVVMTFEAEEHKWMDAKDIEKKTIMEKELKEPLTYVKYTWEDPGFPKGKWNESIEKYTGGGTLKYRYRLAFQGKAEVEL